MCSEARTPADRRRHRVRGPPPGQDPAATRDTQGPGRDEGYTPSGDGQCRCEGTMPRASRERLDRFRRRRRRDPVFPSLDWPLVPVHAVGPVPRPDPPTCSGCSRAGGALICGFGTSCDLGGQAWDGAGEVSSGFRDGRSWVCVTPHPRGLSQEPSPTRTQLSSPLGGPARRQEQGCCFLDRSHPTKSLRGLRPEGGEGRAPGCPPPPWPPTRLWGCGLRAAEPWLRLGGVTAAPEPHSGRPLRVAGRHPCQAVSRAARRGPPPSLSREAVGHWREHVNTERKERHVGCHRRGWHKKRPMEVGAWMFRREKPKGGETEAR